MDGNEPGKGVSPRKLVKWICHCAVRGLKNNHQHDVPGHLFQGRYKAVAVEPDNAGYLEAVSTYIHLNPARAGLIAIGREPLKQYRWSSYPLQLGRSQLPKNARR